MINLSLKKLYYSRSHNTGFRWIYYDKDVESSELKKITGDLIEYEELKNRDHLFVRKLDNNAFAVYKLFLTDFKDDHSRPFSAIVGYIVEQNSLKIFNNRALIFRSLYSHIKMPTIISNDEDECLEENDDISIDQIDNDDLYYCLLEGESKESFLIIMGDESFTLKPLQNENKENESTKGSNCDQLNNSVSINDCQNSSENIVLTNDEILQLKKLVQIAPFLLELFESKQNFIKEENKKTELDFEELTNKIVNEITNNIFTELKKGIKFDLTEKQKNGFKERTIEKEIIVQSKNSIKNK